ncbi:MULTISPECIES: GntR family transcriptional regulator [unclassified Chelatococcus]|uniref:GntR family transcriptional regulator n=1 Tax=unclassified Chelatococcus TaxID=2638111 RepID=UPI001BD0E615|nr:MULTISPECIES: GntR family transcriptional regulator [unclassified Chelatococcus]MBS7699851.1 GntR family transcriptional regulator [Chelatococcus sp. YT9]MBX3558803.1 GntR family transcriptional regulator [Chelatococcus sp.]
MARSSNQSRHRLANQILDLIRDAKFEPGHHLREQQLGDLLGVSRTPIRAALMLLTELGIVEARRNQGFFLIKPFDALHRIEIEVPTSLDQSLYEQLVRDRLAGILPQSLTQSEIAQRYDVDRVVMLRTLGRLSEDGLIARNKGHGWTFLPTLDSKLALHSSYDFRLTIEPASFLLSTFKPDMAALERARLQHMYLASHPDISGVDSMQLFSTDASFHEMFAEFSGNVFFLQAVQQQNRLRRLLEFGGYRNRRRVREWCKEHLAIIDAVLAGDYRRASEVMHAHLSNAVGSSGTPIVREKP